MSRSRYVHIRCGDKTLKEHRIIWEKARGKIPKGYEIHHLNGKSRDNRLSNLMTLTHRDHMRLHSGNFAQDNGQLLKYCTRCKGWKPLSSYYSVRRLDCRTNQTLLVECKPCFRKRMMNLRRG